MDTTASWCLLSPASSAPPCALQLPKRQATLAASPRRSTGSKSRVLCLHDKVHSYQATYLVSTHLASNQCRLSSMFVMISCLLVLQYVAGADRGEGHLAAAAAGGGVAVGRRLGSCVYTNLAPFRSSINPLETCIHPSVIAV
jgi:hypothetical protein